MQKYLNVYCFTLFINAYLRLWEFVGNREAIPRQLSQMRTGENTALIEFFIPLHEALFWITLDITLSRHNVVLYRCYTGVYTIFISLRCLIISDINLFYGCDPVLWLRDGWRHKTNWMWFEMRRGEEYVVVEFLSLLD